MNFPVILNFVRLNEQFLNDLKITKVNIKTDKGTPWGNLLRRTLLTLRAKNRFAGIFLHGNVIFGLKESFLTIFSQLHQEGNFYKLFLDGQEVFLSFSNQELELDPANEYLKLIFRLFIGEIIACQFRNLTDTPYLVEARRDAVFRALKVDSELIFESDLEKKLFKPFSVREGFAFEPRISSTGKIFVIIDPRYRFISEHSFRKLLTSNYVSIKDLQMMLSNKDTVVIDRCPVSECNHNQKPSSLCTIGSPVGGKYLRISKIDRNKKPSEAMADYKEYYKKICIEENNPILKVLKDIPPIAFVNIYGRSYFYPMERLFFEPRFYNLNKSIRGKVMRKIKPRANERYLLTKEFASIIDQMKIHGLVEPIRSSMLQTTDSKTGRWRNTDICLRPKFEGNKGNHFSIIGLLSRFGPYDLNEPREFNKLILTPVNLTGIENRIIMEFLKNLAYGDQSSKFLGVQTVFKLEVQINDPVSKYELIALKKESNSRQCVISVIGKDQIIRGIESFNIDGFIQKNLGHQRIREQTIQKEKIIRGIFWNLALGIYSKIGGIPWKVKICERETNYTFIGLSTDYRDDNIIYSIQTISGRGKWEKGSVRLISKKDYCDSLMKDISTIISEYCNGLTHTFVIHKHGKTLKYEEDVITNILSTQFESVVALYWISIKDSPIRFYQMGGSEGFKAPDIGTWVQIDKNEIAIQLSSEERIPEGTPNPIILEQVYPKTEILSSRAEEIFNLTFLDWGYSRGSISRPITVDYASKSLKKFDFRKNKVLKFDKPWFL